MPPIGIEITQTTAHAQRGRYRTSCTLKRSTKQNTTKAAHTNATGSSASIIISENVTDTENMTSADLLLHPVRLRIVQAFLGERALTTAELRDQLPDLAPASVYRHVALLVDAGVLAIASERRVRGALERTYILRLAAANVGLNELAQMTADEHRQAFMGFVAGLLGDFDRYLDRGDIDFIRDGVSYNLAGMWLTDEELSELLTEIQALFQPRLANGRKAGRKRRIIGSVLLPGER